MLFISSCVLATEYAFVLRTCGSCAKICSITFFSDTKSVHAKSRFIGSPFKNSTFAAVPSSFCRKPVAEMNMPIDVVRLMLRRTANTSCTSYESSCCRRLSSAVFIPFQ